MTLLLLTAGILCLLGSGFYSGCEMGMYALNKVRARLRADAGESQAKLLVDLSARQQETVLSILLWQNVCGYLLTVCTSAWLLRVAGAESSRVEFYSAAILSPLIFVFGDVVPKNWFQVEADRLMYHAARLLRPSVLVFRYTGLLWVLERVSKVIARLLGDRTAENWLSQRAEIVGLLREGAAEGVLTEEQTQIIERVMRLSSIRVGEIMIPRRRVATVPIDASRSLFEVIVRTHNFSRLPVIGRDGRNPMGIVNVYEVLADEERGGAEKWLRPALSIPASESAANALVRLQQARATMALITDPRKGFVGIITLKDVVEEIFGELHAW